MKLFTFKNGIHPDDKKLTKDKPIERILPEKGAILTFPLSQHIGAPAVPIVEIGEEVLMGQKIAEGDGNVSADIHSSVSGIVKKIAPCFTPAGERVDGILIENDGNMTEHESMKENKDYDKLTPEEIVEKVKDAGIIGLGGAGFPTHVKLNVPKDKKIEYVIINASECEPYITSDHRMLLEETEEIINGLKLVLKMFPGAKGIIGIEANKMDACEKMIEDCKGRDDISVMALKPKYPQGAERQIIYACTKREVPSGGLPFDVGVLVFNVDTIASIWKAVAYGRPIIERVVTVTGGAVNNPGNYRVHLGMNYIDLIEQTGGLKEEPYKLISGGPMMGDAMFDLSVPIVKVSNCIICFTEEEGKLAEETACIRCSRCVSACPMGLMPLDLNYYSLYDYEDEFLKASGLECIECGACSYVCPSKRHLAHSIKSLKKTILSQKKEK